MMGTTLKPLMNVDRHGSRMSPAVMPGKFLPDVRSLRLVWRRQV